MNKLGIVFNMLCSAANLNSAAIFALHEFVTMLAVCPARHICSLLLNVFTGLSETLSAASSCVIVKQQKWK